MKNIIQKAFVLLAVLVVLIFTVGIVFIPRAEAETNEMIVPLVKVIDGDTIEIALQLPPPLNKASVRILGIDTPESNYLAKCPREKNLGIQAKLFTHLTVGANNTATLKNFKWDKYGGRIDADVYIGDINIGKSLIDQGLAKPYFGEGDKPDWCR